MCGSRRTRGPTDKENIMSHNHQRSIAFTILLSLTLGVQGFGLAAQKAKSASAKPDPWVKDTLKSYKKLISDRKGLKDAEAIELINKLHEKYEGMCAKDKSAYAKGIADSLLSGRCKRKPTKDGLYRSTIKALSLTGKNGGRYLAKAFDNKKKFKNKEWINLRGDMLEHLGRCKDPKYISFLVDVALKNTSDTLMAKAGGALKYYKETKLTVRKGISKDLIKKFANIYDNANKNLDSNDLVRKTWENRHAAVSDPWNTTLQALTRQHYRSANDWNRFWNKYKSKNWDKPLKKTR
jgi:hypothetical protein